MTLRRFVGSSISVPTIDTETGTLFLWLSSGRGHETIVFNNNSLANKSFKIRRAGYQNSLNIKYKNPV